MGRSASREQLILAGSAGIVTIMAVMAGVRLANRGANPWPWVLAVAAGVTALAGPVRWLIRDRLLSEWNEYYKFVALIGFGVMVPLAVAGLLLAGSVLYRLDILVVGGITGYTVAALSEVTGFSNRFRDISQ